MSGWWLASYLVLWAVMLGVLVVLLVVLRQLGLVYLRLRGRGVPHFNEGPELGSFVEPVSDVDGITGGVSLFPDERASLNLFLFASPHCSLCKETVMAVADVARSRDAGFLVVSEGSAEENRELRGLVDGASHFLISVELHRRMQVESIPFAVVVDGKGVVLAKGIPNDPDQLDELMDQAARSRAAEEVVAA